MTADTSRLHELKIDRGADADARPPRWPWAVAALVAAGAVAWWLLARPTAAEVVTAPAVEVDTHGPTAVLNASGYVTARRQATVSSKVTGKVTEVLVEEGMTVAEGQVLARLDPATGGAALRLAESQAAAAASALEETRVRVAEAGLELRRAEELAAQAVASQADLDRARAQVAALEARLAAQRDELEVARRQVALRRQDVDDLAIRAPFAGVVVSKNAQPGEMISPISAGGGFTRTGICTLVDMGSLEIEVDVNEAYIQRVTAGQPVEARLDAYPDWTIPAHVIAIVPAADRQKATVRVRVGIDGADPRILPDMGVKVAFIGGQPQGAAGAPRAAVGVPKAALRRDGERDVVLVASAGRVERRAVEVGAALGERVEILSGLAAGERVIVEGPAGLADGDAIEEVRR